MSFFRKDQILVLCDVEYHVINSSMEGDVLLENIATGERRMHQSANLLRAYVAGHLLTDNEARATKPVRVKKIGTSAGMDGMSTAAKAETRRRIDYINKLESLGAFDGSTEDLRGHLQEIAKCRNESRPPHTSTIYRWRKRYLKAQKDVRALSAQFDKQGGKGKTRLDAEVEVNLFESIDKIVLGQKVFSAEEVLDDVSVKIAASNAQKPKSEQINVPSLRTVQRRIAELCGYDLAVGKFGKREADRRYALMQGSRAVSRILEIVEIDHSPIDLLVTDSDRQKPIARPVITVVLDRKSRCVLGYHLSSAGYGVAAVFEAVRHALLPKTYLNERYAELELTWPCHGWPEKIVMDNGREFHANAVADALQALSIIAEFAASREPNDKACVERFLRTLNYGLIHKLPGTTLAKAHKRIGFKSEDEAALTLEDLDRIIHVWICDVYHKRPHVGLNYRAPLDVWLDGAAAHPPLLKLNQKDLDIELGEVETSALQHYGIDLNTHVYRSQRLLTLRRMLPNKPKVTVKWSKNDVGYIWVWDEIQSEYIKVPNANQEYAGLTLEQAKAAKKAHAASDVDQQPARAAARAVIRDMVTGALGDKKLKSRKRGSRLDNRNSKALRHGESTPVYFEDDESLAHDEMTRNVLEDEMLDLEIEEVSA